MAPPTRPPDPTDRGRGVRPRLAGDDRRLSWSSYRSGHAATPVPAVSAWCGTQVAHEYGGSARFDAARRETAAREAPGPARPCDPALGHEPLCGFGTCRRRQGPDPQPGWHFAVDQAGRGFLSLHRHCPRIAPRRGFYAVGAARPTPPFAIVEAGYRPETRYPTNDRAQCRAGSFCPSVALLYAGCRRQRLARTGSESPDCPRAGLCPVHGDQCRGVAATFVRDAICRYGTGLWYCQQCSASAVSSTGQLVREAPCRRCAVALSIRDADPAIYDARCAERHHRRQHGRFHAGPDVLLQSPAHSGRASRVHTLCRRPHNLFSGAARCTGRDDHRNWQRAIDPDRIPARDRDASPFQS